MRYEDVVFQTVEDVDTAHDDAIRHGGGAPGMLNPGMVSSATMAPQSGYYGSLAELAAVYAHGIAKNHGYHDANKRTATIVLGQFLGSNGHPVILGPEWVGIMESVADGSISRDQLVEHVTVLMGGDPIVLED